MSHSTIDQLEFIYDEAGRPLQLIFNGRIYNYVLNLQGDVQQLRNAVTGAVVATYLYNAWGQLLQSTGSMAESNPLRYRGYFYDASTGLYYLQSRFYDPVIGRFLNWDGFVSTGQGFLGFNMFVYCLNNPVNLHDPTGYIACACGSGRVCTQNTGAIQSANPIPPPTQSTTGATSQSAILQIANIFYSLGPALRTFGALVRNPDLPDVMRADGLIELPGAVSTVAKSLGYVLMIFDVARVISDTYQQGGNLNQAYLAGAVRFVIIAASTRAGVEVGAGVAKIPYVGPYLAPFAGAGTAGLVKWGATKFEIFGNTIEGHINNVISRMFGW